MSSLVPSVVVTSAWVSPRVKIGAAVGARQDAGFDPDIANLIEGAPIGTALLVDHLLAENALAQRLVILLELLLAPRRRLRAARPAVSS